MSVIESCFNMDFLEYRNIDEISNSEIIKLVIEYQNFEIVLGYAGNMGYDIELIAGVCGITEYETRRELLSLELLSVLMFFVRDAEGIKLSHNYQDLITAYEHCLHSMSNDKETANQEINSTNTYYGF